MAGFWAWCAAICAALASYLHMVGNERIAARRLRELDGLARSQIALAGRGNALQRRLLEVCPGWEPSPTLLLQLLEAAIAQGVAIPRALECIGACCGGACAQVLGHVSAALLRGVCWDEAWAVLEHDGSSPASSALGLACRTLRAAWEDGVSPLPQIHAAIEQMDGVVSWTSFPGDAGLQAEQMLLDMRDQIFGGQVTAEEGMTSTQDAINALLDAQ